MQNSLIPLLQSHALDNDLDAHEIPDYLEVLGNIEGLNNCKQGIVIGDRLFLRVCTDMQRNGQLQCELLPESGMHNYKERIEQYSEAAEKQDSPVLELRNALQEYHLGNRHDNEKTRAHGLERVKQSLQRLYPVKAAHQLPKHQNIFQRVFKIS
jgi:hypothetical protein